MTEEKMTKRSPKTVTFHSRYDRFVANFPFRRDRYESRGEGPGARWVRLRHDRSRAVFEPVGCRGLGSAYITSDPEEIKYLRGLVKRLPDLHEVSR
jgi:hypothetical protein